MAVVDRRTAIVIDGSHLTIDDVACVARDGNPVVLAQAARERIQRCREFVEGRIAGGAVMYGINTGIGELADVALAPGQIKDFQRYLVYSHSAGCGQPLAAEVVRAAMCSRINVLAKGHSGVRGIVVDTLIEMLNKGVTPIVFDRGSVGACGDLSPMSQVALVLLGEGEALYQGQRLAGRAAMEAAEIPVIVFEARDGLATINGSNMTAGYGTLHLCDTERYLKTAEIAAALSLEVVHANTAALDERLHRARGYTGAISCAANMRRILADSEMLRRATRKVQDAYSLRSTPQIVGAAKDAWRWAVGMFETELNGVGDNPIFLPEEETYLTGANFQGTPLGVALDLMATCVTMVGVMSERRTNRLLNASLSRGLPAFLTSGAGMFSGLMLTQYTQDMLICENRILSAPASIGSIPAAADQEDFVSMSFTAARKMQQILENSWYVIAIELMAGAQAAEFRDPALLGQGNAAAYRAVRRHVAPLVEDRPVQYDINRLAAALRSGAVLQAVEAEVGRLEA